MHVRRRRRGIVVHRRAQLAAEHVTRRHGIPVTTVARTIVDLAARLWRADVEAMINEADARDLIDPEALRIAIEAMPGVRGVPALRQMLDRETFVLSDSRLEQLFIPIARRAGLPLPVTRQYVNGFKVDFWWPELGLVVETDSLRYHRTPAKQGRDNLRDQTHAAADLTPLRFTHAQIRFEPAHVEEVLRAVAARLVARGKRA
jgi:very-short-patch-repair endonuclease